MKPVEPQPPMPQTKFYLHLAILLVAIGLLVGLICLGKMDGERRIALSSSVMVSLFIITATELIPEGVRRWGRYSRRGRFERFFGTAALKDKTRLIFAHRRLDKALPDPWVLHHQPRAMEEGRPVAEGVDAWLAVQDIRAAVYLANELYQVTGREVEIRHDKDMEERFDYCAISIGLGFNGFTHHLAALCNGKLFNVVWGRSPKGFAHLTDLFSVGGDPAMPPAGRDYALVARIVPKTEDGHPKQVCFVCAGRTAAGTAAAGYFLAKEWAQIVKLYEREKLSLDVDSLAVVIEHVADESGIGLYDATAHLAKQGSRELLNWGRVAGV